MTRVELKIKNVGIVGCGQMGSGIAQVVLLAGYKCRVYEKEPSLLDRGLKAIARSLGKAVEKGKCKEDEARKAENRLKPCPNLADLAVCELVVEAVTEDSAVKENLFQQLNAVCRPDAIFATNTSSLSVTALMGFTGRPERFLGVHFFNPVPVMRLVEIVATVATDEAVIETVTDFVGSLGKSPVRCMDRSGFLVNRLLIPYLLDAVRALESGTGSMADIDTAMKLGCGHPMGPFELMDFIGLDTVYQIANILFEEFRESRMAPPPTLRRLVLAGRQGRKVGIGFYDYRPKGES